MNSDRVIQIRASLQSEEAELDLLFLKAVLPVLEKFEKIFQQDKVMIHK